MPRDTPLEPTIEDNRRRLAGELRSGRHQQCRGHVGWPSDPDRPVSFVGLLYRLHPELSRYDQEDDRDRGADLAALSMAAKALLASLMEPHAPAPHFAGFDFEEWRKVRHKRNRRGRFLLETYGFDNDEYRRLEIANNQGRAFWQLAQMIEMGKIPMSPKLWWPRVR